MALLPEDTPTFERDVKRLKRKYVELEPLKDVIRLILENSSESLEELRRRHNMHDLKGEWKGSSECHIANAGDWLLVWRTNSRLAVFQRTGSHDDIFR